MSGKLLSLNVTTLSKGNYSTMINTSQVVEIEPDPREDAASNTIVKLVNGRKLYCVNTYDDLMEQYQG